MYNFEIHFVYPWLLLLLIPAVGLMLFHYFRLSKKYRRTRNRILSLVFHSVIMTLCIAILAGISFTYNVDNSKNEIILLVDKSFSTEAQREAENDYIKDVIAMGEPNVYKLGIVTFGYDQVKAVPLTSDYDSVYNKYVQAKDPDPSASDIAAALLYAKGMFHNGEASKIVLLTDGIETDESAQSVIRDFVSEGIRVDVVSLDAPEAVSDVQMMDATLPDYNIALGEKFDITVNMSGRVAADASPSQIDVTMYDNGEEVGKTAVNLTNGAMSALFAGYSFSTGGLHTLKFEASGSGDLLDKNNTLYAYLNLNEYNNVLIIEKFRDTSEKLRALLDGYNVSVVHPEDVEMPGSISDLRRFDEVILNNIANEDMPEGFDEMLNSYVYDYGGGLFTVGGGEQGDPETAHAFNRVDMSKSLYYRQMLPVEAINYTPPLGLMLVVDISGSMDSSTDSGVTKLIAAKNSALSIVNDRSCLSERDYCGVMTLSDSFTQEIRLMPMTRQNDIRNAILNISGTGGTVFSPSVERAGKDLRALYESGAIQKMHVIIITDGAASDFQDYIKHVEYFHDRGVTYSFVAINAGVDSMTQLNTAAEIGGGIAVNASASNLTNVLKDDIRIPEIKETELGPFTPKVDAESYFSTIVDQDSMPKLDGFYGTRAKREAQVYMTGDYNVPIYAQWRYGMGNVGSFMCDLDGVWSGEFLNSEYGRLLVMSIVSKLMPSRDVKNTDINVIIRPENYKLGLSIYTLDRLGEDERIEIGAVYFEEGGSSIKVVQPTKADNYSRAAVETYKPGMYWINVNRVNSKNELISSYTLHYAFSFSEEYDVITDRSDRTELTAAIADSTGGVYAVMGEADVSTVFGGFVTRLFREYDPRLVFITVAIALFLLDIAVRKFKFKWIHELIAEHKENKKRKNEGGAL